MSFQNYKHHKNVHISTHPFIKTLVDKLRKQETTSEEYVSTTKKICYYLVLGALENLSLKNEAAKVWTGEKMELSVPNEKFVLIPILRAGMSMLNTAKEILGNYSDVSFIDYERNEETLVAKENYKKLSKINGSTIIILDPMLATGGTLDTCVSTIKKHECKKIIALSVISAPEGIEKILSKHKDVEIYTAQLDEKLNEHGFILPGLGDFGDRTFGSYEK